MVVKYEVPYELCKAEWLGLCYAIIESGYAEQDEEFIKSDFGIYGQLLAHILSDKEVHEALENVRKKYTQRNLFYEELKRYNDEI